MSLETTLAELEPMLYGFNYEVFLRAYPVSLPPGSSTAAYVADALGSSATRRAIQPTLCSGISLMWSQVRQASFL
jgi:hypothetical protein